MSGKIRHQLNYYCKCIVVVALLHCVHSVHDIVEILHVLSYGYRVLVLLYQNTYMHALFTTIMKYDMI